MPTTRMVYLITSRSARHADPALIAGWIQGHGIGDGCPMRCAMNLTRLAGQAPIAPAHRGYA